MDVGGGTHPQEGRGSRETLQGSGLASAPPSEGFCLPEWLSPTLSHEQTLAITLFTDRLRLPFPIPSPSLSACSWAVGASRGSMSGGFVQVTSPTSIFPTPGPFILWRTLRSGGECLSQGRHWLSPWELGLRESWVGLPPQPFRPVESCLS